MYENVSCRVPVGIIFGCPSILELLAAVLPGFLSSLCTNKVKKKRSKSIIFRMSRKSEELNLKQVNIFQYDIKELLEWRWRNHIMSLRIGFIIFSVFSNIFSWTDCLYFFEWKWTSTITILMNVRLGEFRWIYVTACYWL